jgi:hypothetical protein
LSGLKFVEEILGLGFIEKIFGFGGFVRISCGFGWYNG